MRRVILETPYAGDVQSNVEYARLCLKDCLERGEAPIASHLLYTQVLDDTLPEERALGIEAGYAWLHGGTDAVVVYLGRGCSPGMRQAIKVAETLRVPVEYRFLSVADLMHTVIKNV
jgi:hypothetical protein